MNNYYFAYTIAGTIGVAALLLGLKIPIQEEAKQSGGVSAWKKFNRGIEEVASSKPIVISSVMESAQYLAVGALSAFLPTYALGVGLNAGEIALLFLAQGSVTLVARPFAGMASDKIGRKPMIVFGLILGAITLMIIPATAGLIPLMALSAIFGLSVGIVTPSTTALVADLAKGARLGAAMGVFGTIWDIGEASGPIIAGVLIVILSNYFLSFTIISIAVLLLASIFVITVSDPVTKPVDL